MTAGRRGGGRGVGDVDDWGHGQPAPLVGAVVIALVAARSDGGGVIEGPVGDGGTAGPGDEGLGPRGAGLWKAVEGHGGRAGEARSVGYGAKGAAQLVVVADLEGRGGGAAAARGPIAVRGQGAVRQEAFGRRASGEHCGHRDGLAVA